MKKMILVAVIVCVAIMNSYGYGVKGMKHGVRKSKYHNYSYSSTKSGHGINGCGYRGCHGSLCRGGYTSKMSGNNTSSFNVNTALAVIRTVNQTASTVNRIKTNNERVTISRDNLEVRKYNSGINSKFGKKTESVPETVNAKVEIANGVVNNAFYREKYEYYCEKYNSEKNKSSNLAHFYLDKMNEYGEKIGISPVTSKK